MMSLKKNVFWVFESDPSISTLLWSSTPGPCICLQIYVQVKCSFSQTLQQGCQVSLGRWTFVNGNLSPKKKQKNTVGGPKFEDVWESRGTCLGCHP